MKERDRATCPALIVSVGRRGMPLPVIVQLLGKECNNIPSVSRYLSCVPKKDNPKKGTRRKSFTAGSAALGTFRKPALRASDIRNASPSGLVARPDLRPGLPVCGLTYRDFHWN